MGKRTISDDTFDLAYVDKQLRAMRAWFDGFRGGGGQYPHDVDVLRKAQVLLSSSRPLKTHEETERLKQSVCTIAEEIRGKLREIGDALDDIDVVMSRLDELNVKEGFEGEKVERQR